jgi:hypothetical protein
LGIKYGILLNGSAKIPNAAKLLEDASQLLLDVLQSKTGIEEIDGSAKEESEDEIFRFGGSVDILAHILNKYARRFCKPTDALFKKIFEMITQSGLMKKLIAIDEYSGSSSAFEQVLEFYQDISIKTNAKKAFEPEMAQVVKDGFAFIHKNYLEFDEKRDARQALLNLLMLNNDNYTDINDDSKIVIFTKEMVRTIAENAPYKEIIENDMKMVSSDIVML